MTQWNQFDEMNESKPIECAVCEAMCPDAVDGTLTPLDRRLFENHVAHCANCARELEEAQRGAAWLGMLKGHTPEPPAALLAKILAETTGAEDPKNVPPVFVQALPVRAIAPAWALTTVLRKVGDVFRIETARANFQPRMAMTAAMAFVSIALTLNLTGVKLKNLRASDFTPSGIRRNVVEVGASAARNFQNMRVVYQVESRMNELRGEGPLAQREDANFTVPQNGTAQPQPQQAAPAPHKVE